MVRSQFLPFPSPSKVIADDNLLPYFGFFAISKRDSTAPTIVDDVPVSSTSGTFLGTFSTSSHRIAHFTSVPTEHVPVVTSMLSLVGGGFVAVALYVHGLFKRPPVYPSTAGATRDLSFFNRGTTFRDAIPPRVILSLLRGGG